MMKGLIQYYRETAHYNEAIYQWVDRLGLVHIREMLFEEDMRTQLLKNLSSDISLLQNLSAGKTPYERMKLLTEPMLRYFRDKLHDIQSEKHMRRNARSAACNAKCSLRNKPSRHGRNTLQSALIIRRHMAVYVQKA